MKKILFIAITAIIYLTTSGHLRAKEISKPAKDSVAVRSAISKVNIAYNEAFARGDSALFLNCYAGDGCIMPANSPALCSKTGLLAFYKLGYKMGVRGITFNTIALFGLTDQYVTEQGTYNLQDADGRSLGKGKYLVLWKKTASGWKMFRDMFNNDAPPAKSSK